MNCCSSAALAPLAYGAWARPDSSRQSTRHGAAVYSGMDLDTNPANSDVTFEDLGPTLHEAVRLLVAAAKPSKIILFGSRARGDADDGSDFDILVVEPSAANRRTEMVRLQEAVAPLCPPIDILVFSNQDVTDWGDVRGTVLYPALREGLILYDAA